MQTFMPYPSFEQSARVLDYKRLGKQRLEAKQILRIVSGMTPDLRWRNHPAVKMWIGYEEALKLYTNEMILEWVNRGYKNTMEIYDIKDVVYPWWFGNEDFHRSHRSRLLAKNFDFYLPYFPEDIGFNGSKYFWPVSETHTYRVI
jgi:hypothetical protein